MQNGAGILEIGECLGHTSFSNTQKHVHLTMLEVMGTTR
jgi:site-specific recombinase XerD